jgi:hypothetical protein
MLQQTRYRILLLLWSALTSFLISITTCTIPSTQQGRPRGRLLLIDAAVLDARALMHELPV